MKSIKVLSIIALSALALSANAVNKVKITLTGANGANAAELNILEKSGSSIEWSATTDGDPINMWAVYSSVKYSSLYALDIQGVKIGFKGNSNTSYTMTFTKFEGTVNLYDAAEDSVIVIANNGTYEFTCAANTEITDRFQIGEPQPQNVYVRGDVITPLPTDGFGTICLPWKSTALEGGEFFEVLGKDATKGVALGQVTALTAGKPYVFKTGAESTQIKVTYDPTTEVTTEVVVAGIIGSFDGCGVPAGMYIIKDNLLYKTADATSSIEANRAYFDLVNMPAYSGNAPGRKVIFMGSEATGLNTVEAVAGKAQKMMINGQMVIMKGDKMFNAQGAAL